MVDNQAALTIAKCGANWRTRYFAVRAHRLHEYLQGHTELEHCLTKEMLADTLTKLATAPVILVLHDAMDGIHINHKTSVSPGQQNQGDEAGDGPPGRQPRHTTSVSTGRQNRSDGAGDGPSAGTSPDKVLMSRHGSLKCGSSCDTKPENYTSQGDTTCYATC